MSWLTWFFQDVNKHANESVCWSWVTSVWGYVAVICVLGFFIASCVHRRRGGSSEEAGMLLIFGPLFSIISFPFWPLILVITIMYYVWDFASKPPKKIAKEKRIERDRSLKSTKNYCNECKHPIANCMCPELLEAEKEVEEFLKERKKRRVLHD